jgi:hypothetical protein
MDEKRDVAPLWPTIRQVIEDAEAAGWSIQIIGGRRVFVRPGWDVVPVPDSDDDEYTRLVPTVSNSIYRSLGILGDCAK